MSGSAIAVSNGRILEAEIEDNEISDNTVMSSGSDILMQNSQLVTEAVIKLSLKRNHIHGNKQGLTILNASCVNNSIFVSSTADRIENNGLGLSLSAGFNALGKAANGNSIRFEAEATSIRNQ